MEQRGPLAVEIGSTHPLFSAPSPLRSMSLGHVLGGEVSAPISRAAAASPFTPPKQPTLLSGKSSP